MTITISNAVARRLALQTQGLYNRRSFGSGLEGTEQAIAHLGYVQIDTLSVVARAHLHTLWNRVAGFQPSHIDALQSQRKIFEHWSHALAFLPMDDYRFSLPMMNRIAAGESHWYPKESKHTKRVLKRITEEGPLSSRDFDDKVGSKEMWARSPSKRALEQLFMEGTLMIPERRNFHKVYDLRERVLPEHVDTRTPTTEEYCQHLISSYVRSHGFGQIKEATYLRKGLGQVAKRVAEQMLEENLVGSLQVGDQQYLCSPDVLELLDSAAPRSQLRILNPFDNAVIQRQRVSDLFAFDYQIECYVPKQKRKYGYFCLPILQGNKLVARMDAKASRKDKVLHIFHLAVEDNVKNQEHFFDALHLELQRFLKFNGCESIQIHKLSGAQQKPNWG